MKLLTASLLGLMVATPLAAQEPQPDERPREHVVRTGDTLWDLAGHYFRNPFGWPAIYEANLSVVEDPHWIYPEEVLIIPGLYDPNDPRPPAPVTVATRPLDRPVRTVFYREVPATSGARGPSVLSDPVLARLPVKPGEFHSAEFIANPGRLPVMARMIRPTRTVEIADREARPTAHPMDIVFMGYASDDRPAIGTRVLMVRVGDRISAAGSGARVIHPTAIIRVTAHNEDVMEGQVVNQFEPVHLDQLVIPLGLFPDFLTDAAEEVAGDDLQGVLMEFVTDQPLYGTTDRGFLNLGASSGVQVGDVFAAYLPERSARRRDRGEILRRIEQIPPEVVAELRVVRVTDRTATFKVDRLTLPVLEDGMRVRRIRKMP